MSLGREIFKHAAIYSFATVLGKLISFVMLPFYAEIFRAEGYGVIAMIDASLGMLAILFAGGFHGGILRIYHEQDQGQKGMVISTAMRLVFGLGLAAITIPIIFSKPLSSLLLGSDEYSLLLSLSLITFVIDVGGYSASTSLVIRQKSIFYSAVNLIRLVVGLALNIWLVLILDVGLIGVFISALVAALIASSLCLFAAISEHGIGYDKQIARKLLRFQLPLLPGDVISYLSRQAERFLVRYIIDIRAVGVLEMAYKFPPLLNLFLTLPMLKAWNSRCIEIAEQDHDAPRIIAQMFTNYFFVMVFSGLVLAVGIEDVLKLLTPPEFWGAAQIARIEILTTILAGSNSFLIFGLAYRKKTGVISVIKTVMGLLKLPLAYVMIMTFSLSGAAFSALLVETIHTFTLHRKSQEYYRVEYEYVKLGLVASCGAVVYLTISSHILLPSIDPSLFGEMLIAFMSQEKREALLSLLINSLACMVFLVVAPLLFFRNKR